MLRQVSSCTKQACGRSMATVANSLIDEGWIDRVKQPSPRRNRLRHRRPHSVSSVQQPLPALPLSSYYLVSSMLQNNLPRRGFVISRCFSNKPTKTANTAKSNNQPPAVDMKALLGRCQTCVQTPPGELTPEDWMDMEDAVEKLLPQRTSQSLDVTLRLLDRLAQEQGVIQALTRAEWVDSRLLQRVMQKWSRQITHSGSSKSSASALVYQYNPVVMVQKIDHYCRFFRQMQWSSQVAYYLVSTLNQLLKVHHPTRLEPLPPHGLDFAPALLDRLLVTEFQHNGNRLAQPAPELFQAVAHACTWRGIPSRERVRAAHMMDDLLHKWTTVYEAPDVQLYTSAVNAWASTRSFEGAQKAHERLDQMFQARHDNISGTTSLENGSEDGTTTSSSMAAHDEEQKDGRKVPGWVWVNALRSAIDAWAWSKHPDTLRRVQVLLVRTTNFIESGMIPAQVSTTPIWNAALRACAVAASPAAVDQAQSIVQVFDRGDAVADRHTFYWFIACLVNAGDIQKGESLLIEMMESGTVADVSEDFLSTVVHGWARSHDKDKLRHAQQLIDRVQQLSNGKLKLSNATYNALLECCATSTARKPYYAAKAAQLLEQMKDLATQENNRRAAPDLKSYTHVIRCLASIGDGDTSEKLYEELFEKYTTSRDHRFQPDTVLFNAVMTAYNNNRNKNVLQQAHASFQKCFERHRSGQLAEGPDAISFTTLVSVIARAEGTGKIAIDRAKIASKLLEQLQNMYTREGKQHLQPSTAMYNAVMNCWAKAGSTGDCESTLERMLQDFRNGNEKALPDIQSFNVLLKALSVSSDEGKSERADSLLARIKDLHRSDILRSGPNLLTYTTIIECHVGTGGPEALVRAEATLREMESEYENGNLSSPPNDETYEMVRNAMDNPLAPA